MAACGTGYTQKAAGRAFYVSGKATANRVRHYRQLAWAGIANLSSRPVARCGNPLRFIGEKFKLRNTSYANPGIALPGNVVFSGGRARRIGGAYCDTPAASAGNSLADKETAAMKLEIPPKGPPIVRRV